MQQLVFIYKTRVLTSLVLEPHKKYTQKVAQTFHISQAALDVKSTFGEPVQLVVEYENSNFILGTLSKEAKIFQIPLDLIFKVGDQVSFRVIGKGTLHLSGYHVLDDFDNMLMGQEEESDYEEEMEVEEKLKKRKKKNLNVKENKKAKLDKTNEYESDDSNENLLVKPKKKKEKNNSLSNIKDSENDGNDGSDNEDDAYKLDDQISDENDNEDEDFDNGKEKLSLTSESPKTPNGTAHKLKKNNKVPSKLNKSLESKLDNSQDMNSSNSEKKGKKQNKILNEKKSSDKKKLNDSKDDEKTPKGKNEKKVLEGGVISEEIKVGHGPLAKPGKMVNVYYVGSLQSTKKQFDSVQSGPGFKFRLGKNEVIKGWDIGLNGMKVGGVRKLTIPSHLAYGVKGSPPVIPPNSTLVFTVELKGLS
ncbi:46 kDa FK506-binding nuclear protein, putative [Pediculus humanus corporis]|uniref:FK506-binding protein n=1 Tax=Pediculus humanus subsp. corporis TaxID=121224 RepID=E0VJG3_PEDHC|nr:46 kDa FK506-binding nuclear protein, putative [Pediculus humanus corporis]EEB13519.1 46 kDa FK506-binding nuclear protein, putative [Pediculus humanus corporis]